MQYSFEEIEAAGIEGSINAHPLWWVLKNKKADQEVLKWLENEFESLLDENKERIKEINKNFEIVKGAYSEKIIKTSDRDINFEKRRLQRKVIVNHSYDFVEQKVARVSRYKPNVVYVPQNDEFKDKIDCKVIKMYWDFIKQVSKFDEKVRRIARLCYTAGFAPLYIGWDDQAGGEHPDYTLMKDKGKTEIKINGKPYKLDKPVMLGDVCLDLWDPRKFFYEKVVDGFREPQFCFRYSSEHVDKLDEKYPALKQQAQRDNDNKYFYGDEEKRIINHAVVVEFWHKKCADIPEGAYFKFVKGTLLEQGPLKFDHGELPVEVLGDITSDDEQYPYSFLRNIKVLNAQINNLTTIEIRNLKMVGSPKWFVPAGSVRLETLNNDISIVQYAGPNPPKLAQANPTPPQLTQVKAGIKEDMQQIAGVFSVSRGEPPTGIKAGVALKFLNEQENERENDRVANFNKFIVRVAAKVTKVAAQYYDKSDKRTLRILGKNNEWMCKDLDPEVLATPFDCKIQNASALYESKAQVTQDILDLNEGFPGIIPQEQVLDLLDFGQSDKFLDVATVAIKSAEAENDAMLYEGQDIEPEEYELHMQHWMIHVQAMQQHSFGHADVPKKSQDTMKKHVLGHEYLMDKIAKKNPEFFKKLMMLEQYPIFWTPPPPPLPPEPPMEQPPMEPPMAPEGAEQIPAELTPGPMEGEALGIGPEELPPSEVQAIENQGDMYG